jgi:hypothetical protein
MTKYIIRQNEFCDPALISVFTGTWNVNNKLLNDKDTLSDWLLPSDQFVADIFAIGTNVYTYLRIFM